MQLSQAHIKNFRRLDSVEINFEQKETLFVGANNSGKTSATSAFRCFLGDRKFKIHDFPVTLIDKIDQFDLAQYDDEKPDTHLPTISLDLWFSVDPKSIEYGRVGSLLSQISSTIAQVGIGCRLQASDVHLLWRDYTHAFKVDATGKRSASLSRFLSLNKNLSRYFSIVYFALNRSDTTINKRPIHPKEGKRTLNSLLRVDFVDAQRNIQDDEETSRGSKLSSAFQGYYKENLEQASAGEAAIAIVEQNNNTLTDHYETSFGELMGVLKDLGVPSAHERELKIVSNQSPEEALQGNSELFYVKDKNDNGLPEAYNGLGFKNLILMAVQLRDFQMQWANTEEDRPLCHVIFIEEPEVHLHAQIQQTFIANMWNILDKLKQQEGIAPQLVITTHSSHVLNSIDFEKVRYFRRCAPQSTDDQELRTTSEVHNLRDFKAKAIESNGTTIGADDARDFLKKYMTLTHCDLMFSDAAILVEGSVERLLLPVMLKRSAPELSSCYLTVLEVGGAYAQIFSDLMAFLHIPYLVITDIDAVTKKDGKGHGKARSAIEPDAFTSNSALKAFFAGKKTIAEFNAVLPEDHIQADGQRYVAYQKPVNCTLDNKDVVSLHGRTLEETFVYENITICSTLLKLPSFDNTQQFNVDVSEFIGGSTFKKTHFALQLLTNENWVTPHYIKVGLDWLVKRLCVNTTGKG